MIQDKPNEVVEPESKDGTPEKASTNKEATPKEPQPRDETETKGKPSLEERLREQGRQLKKLEEELTSATAKLKAKEEAELDAIAASLGLSSEDRKMLGLDTAEKLNLAAEKFQVSKDGKKPVTFKVDSGKGSGVGKIPWEQVHNMPDKDLNELKKKHNAERLEDLVEKGVVAAPR